MARQEIILGTAPTGLGGDPPRTASTKINAMTAELYAATNSLGSAATRTVQTARKANTNELLVAGFNGLGTSNDLRGSIYITGQPADVFGTGTCTGFAEASALGISGLPIPSYGVLHSEAHYTDASAGAGVNQTFDLGIVTYRRYPASATAWRAWEQVGGVVTGSVTAGAIMERGSTATGQWTKFANGLLVCWTPSITPSLLNTANIGVVWQFPAAFVATPTVTAGLRSGDVPVQKALAGPFGISSTATSVNLYMLSPTGSFVAGDVASVTFQATATGWWK